MDDKCIAPNEINDGDLLAFLEGDAATAVTIHLANCHYCQSELESLRSTNALFSATLHRESCPPAEDLLQFEANLLGKQQRSQIIHHIDSCRWCAAELEQLHNVTSRDTDTVQTPFSKKIAETAKRLLEAILQPFPQAPPALALRGRDTSRIYEVDNYRVILSQNAIPGLDDLWELEGLVSLVAASPTVFTGTAVLMLDNELVAQDVVDEFGYFGMGNVRSNTYTLQIELETAVILISELTIQ